jgi:hypothetical protein
VGTDARLPRRQARCCPPVDRGPAPRSGDTNDHHRHPATIDEGKLATFVGQAVVGMGAAISGLLLHIGDRLACTRQWPVPADHLDHAGAAHRHQRAVNGSGFLC